MSKKISSYNLKDRNFKWAFSVRTREMLENLGIPGNLIKDCKLYLKTVLNKELMPDAIVYVELVKNNVVRKIVYIIEHQSYITDANKMKVIKEYLDEIKCKTDRPVDVFIVTSIDPGKHEKEYLNTNADILRPTYIYISPDDIKKMLNNINYKVKNNIPISDTEAVQLIIALIFSPKGHEKEIYDEVYDIVRRDNTMSHSVRIDVVDVLQQFSGKTFGEETLKELLKMTYENIEARRMAVRELFKEEFDKKDQEINSKDQEINSKDQEINSKNQEINHNIQVINSKVQEINSKNKIIKSINKKLKQYEDCVKQLINMEDMNPEAKEILKEMQAFGK